MQSLQTNKTIQAAVVRVTVSRETGQKISEEIIGFEKVDEDAFYRPLIEIFGKRVLEALHTKEDENEVKNVS